MKKKMLIYFIILLFISVFIWGCSRKKHIYTGTLEQDKVIMEAEMSIEYPRFYEWFGSNSTFGMVKISSNSGLMKYEMCGDFDTLNDDIYIKIVKYNEKINSTESGYIIFDKEMKNVILEGRFCIFTSADEEFVNKVNGY